LRPSRYPLRQPLLGRQSAPHGRTAPSAARLRYFAISAPRARDPRGVEEVWDVRRRQWPGLADVDFARCAPNPNISRAHYTKAAFSGINISAKKCFRTEGGGSCYDTVYPVELRV